MKTLASNSDLRIRLLYAVALIALAAFFLPASSAEANAAPGAPVGLVLAPGNGKLTAGWNPPKNNGGANITAYSVQYKTSSAPDSPSVLDDPYSGWVDATHSGTETDAEIAGLTNGVSYDVRVAASNSRGRGPWTASASAAPHEDVIWSAILTVDDHVNGQFYGCTIDIMDESHDRMVHCSVAMTEDEFVYEGKTYSFRHFIHNAGWDSYTVILTALASSGLRKADLHIGGDTYALDDADTVEWYRYLNQNGFHISLSGETVSWSKGQKVPLFLGASTALSSDATLSALTVSDGTNDVPLTPAFDSNTAGYTATVDNSVGSITVTPTVNDEDATVTVEGSAVTSGKASPALSLSAGVAKAIDVVVTAQDGTTNTYTVTVTRASPPKSSDATLSALTVSDGTNDVSLTPEFAAATTGYTASVVNSVDSVTVTPTVNDANATVTVTPAANDGDAEVTVEDSEVTSGTATSPIALTAGTPRAISVMVTAEDGTTTMTYTVTVTRALGETLTPTVVSNESSDATRSALSVSDGTNDVPLTPAFASDTADYTASVDSSVGSVTVTPTVNDPNATVTVEGSTVASGTASSPIALIAGASKSISVVVTAQNGIADTYTVTVTRDNGEPPALPVKSTVSTDATLSALAVSDGTNDVPLTPDFASDTTGYTASVDNSVGSVTVTPTVSDENATVTVGGSAVTSGEASSAISLTAGSAETIEIVVTAQDGVTTKTYTVTVTRENAADTSTQQLQDPDDEDGEIIEMCRRLHDGNIEGLRVCSLGYEGGEAVMMLTLDGPAPAGGTTVTLATDSSQTATAGEDYTMPSSITIGEGQISGLITIPITDDDDDEGDEYIHIYVCIRPGCDPLNPVDGEKEYNHGIVIPGTRSGGL